MTLPTDPTPTNPEEKNPAQPFIPEGDLAQGPAFVEDTSAEPQEYVHVTSTARRRRRNQLIDRPADDERAELLDTLARRAVPTFDFFLFSLLSGALLGLGYVIDSPAVLLFGVLIAPLMAPWLGISMATITASTRFLGQALGGFFVGIGFVFFSGLLAGFASRLFDFPTAQAFQHSRLWIPELALLVVGAVLFALTFTREESKLVLPGILLTYGLYLPVSAAGFGLGNGVPGLWPNAIMVFAIHFSIATIAGLLTFLYMGFRPVESSGYILPGATILILLALIVGMNLLGAALPAISVPIITQSTPESSLAFTPTPQLTSVTESSTQLVAATPTFTPEPVTPTPDITATPTVTEPPSPTPAPVYGRVQAPGANGGIMRENAGDESGGKTFVNGFLVEILSAPVLANGDEWVLVRIVHNGATYEGWMLTSIIVISPAPTAP